MNPEEVRNQRRDRKLFNKKYAPKVGGLPKGYPVGYWLMNRDARATTKNC